MDFIKEFSQIGKADAATAGGKGASLGEMTSAGIPVPPGFVILSNAFEHFLAETDLNTEIDTVLHAVDQREMGTVENASAKIQALILNAKMPDDIAKSVQDFYKKLDTQFVAVRSSATAEDSASAAWAGQLDSFLNTTEETLLANVQKCWASLFTPRAIFYRYEKELHKTKISVAVVVQKMVQSEVSGIAFSVHPVTEDYNQLIIEAGFGLGEAIVSGSVTPDSYVIEKNPRRIIDKNITYQSRALWRAENGGNEWRELSLEEGSKPALSDEQALELAKIILLIESHYAFPCDIEWAYEAGAFYITQSRPITTLAPKERSEFISSELMGFDPDAYNFVGQWKDFTFSSCFWVDCYRPELFAKLGLTSNEVGSMKLSGGYFFTKKSESENIQKQVGEKIVSRDEVFFKNMITVTDKVFEAGVKSGQSLRTKEPSVENFKQFVDMAQQMNFLWLLGAGPLIESAEEKFQEIVVKESFPAEHVLDIVPQVITPLYYRHKELVALEEEVRGKSLSEIRSNAKLHQRLQEQVEKYPWIEILNFMGERLTLERLYEQIEHMEDTPEKSKYIPAKPLSTELSFRANCLRDCGYVKQAGAEYFSIFSELVRPFLDTVAQQIGVTYREMMSLTPAEIAEALQGDLGSTELQTRILARVDTQDGIMIAQEGGGMIFTENPGDIKLLLEKMVPRADTSMQELKGQIGNPGKYTGPVKIIMNTSDFSKMEAGDVLVSTMTTPDFVILMQKSGAIVTDIGGMLCHAAIVSREINTPCIIGTKFATQILHDGDLVEVDADKGVVRILKRAEDGGLKKNESITELIKKTDWHSDWSGPFSLFGLSLPTNTYFEGMEKYFGKGFSRVLIAFKNGIAFSRLPDDEYHEIGMHLTEKARDKDFVKQWSSRFKSFADKIIRETPTTAEGYIRKLPELIPHYQAYGAHNVATKIAFDVGYDKLSKESKDILEEARKYSETFYKNDADTIEKALRFLAGKTGYAYEEIFMLTYDELRSYLDNGVLPDHDTLKKRWVASGVYFTKNRITILSPEQLADIENHRLGASRHTELAGQIAYTGKVRGACRIILDFKNARFEKGEILVTGMTDPNFVELMKKAAGIVTDGGGMLSHAAIVARELQKPCVIGTRVATQVLHDGDLVEVDADSGVVRILENSHKSKNTLYKMLERDTTLVMQAFFDLAMTDDMQEVHGFTIPYRPMELHYVTDANIQIWESEQGEKWFLDRLLEENVKGTAFMESVIERYTPLLTEIQTYWRKGALTDKAELRKYFEVLRRGIPYIATCFYVGLDDRTPEAAQKLAVKMRETDELFSHGDEFVRDCFAALGRNRDLAYLVLPEEFLGTLPSDEELLRRSKGSALLDGKEFAISTLEEFAKNHPEFELRDLVAHASETKEVQGQSAFRGKVSGLVRIVKNRKQAAAVGVGDIIVSPMTTPDFINAMKIAGAFVTDEGGVTCHAAIVAREMKKPCVIGTKIATQVFKDGDMVEVDAEKGVVRILEKHDV